MSLGPFKIVVTSPLASPLAGKADKSALDAFIAAEGSANDALAEGINLEINRALAAEGNLATAISGKQAASTRLTALANVPIAADTFLVGNGAGGYDALLPLSVRQKIGATSQPEVKKIAYQRANMFGDSATMDGPDVRVLEGFGAFTGSAYKDFVGTPLKNRGLVRGWASAINGQGSVGTIFSNVDFDGRNVTVRWAVETSVPNQFGYAIVYFKDAADNTIATFTQDQAEFSVVETLSTTQRICQLTFQAGSPPPYGFYITHDMVGTGAQATIGGLQYHASQFDALDIPVDDFPAWAPAPAANVLLGRENIREFPRIRDRLVYDQASLTMHVVFGPADSHSEYRIWLRNLTRQWKAALGNGGPGWTGVGYPENAGQAAVGGNVDEEEMAVTFSGTGWSGQWMSAAGSPDCCSASTSTAGNRATFTYNGRDNITSAKLHFLGGAAVSQYRWNGGAWTTLNLSGTGAQAVAITGMPTGAWTLEWEHVSGDGRYDGATFLTGLRGIVVHDLAVAGSDLHRWVGEEIAEHPTVNAVTWRSSLAAAMNRLGSVSAFICPIGTNDQTYNRSYASYEANVRSWINQVARVARPGADILMVMAPENGRSAVDYPKRMERYAARAKKVVQELSASLIDLQPLFGATYGQYGHAGTRRVLFDTDALHPNDAGGAVYRHAICEALEQGGPRTNLVTGWQTPALQNSWVAYTNQGRSVPKFKRDPSGKVILKGHASGGVANTNLFNLPVGYRPTERLFFTAETGSGVCRITVDVTGPVFVVLPVDIAGVKYISLDGIAFDTQL